MTLQLLLLGDAPVAQLVERARLAEANGYSAVWMADERFYREVYSCLGELAAPLTAVVPVFTATAIISIHDSRPACGSASLTSSLRNKKAPGSHSLTVSESSCFWPKTQMAATPFPGLPPFF